MDWRLLVEERIAYIGMPLHGEGLWLWLLALLTGDRWHVTHDAHVEIFSISCMQDFHRVGPLGICLVSMLLSAHAKRCNVSRMLDFFLVNGVKGGEYGWLIGVWFESLLFRLKTNRGGIRKILKHPSDRWEHTSSSCMTKGELCWLGRKKQRQYSQSFFF